MKKKIIFIIFCGLAIQIFSIIPSYYGARSLSLGYGSTAFNYDINSIFLNPSLLSSINYTIWGYQYQQSYMDYKNFSENLSEVLSYKLNEFNNLDESDKVNLFSQLSDIFQSKAGISGFRSNVPGFATRTYGLSVSLINTAIVNPIPPDENFFNQDIGAVSNTDISSLKMNFIGLNYRKISLSMAMELSQGISIGVTLNYLNGKITEFNRSITDEIFTTNADSRDYLELGWDNAEKKFSKIVADVGVMANLGQFFNIGLVYRNFGAAKINSPSRKIALNKRIIAGFAFKPNPQWGFFIDMDIKKAQLLYNNEEMQPISIGIEKGFFNNKFFIRAGMLNDLTEKKLLGKESNVLYSVGIGFNMGKFVVDAGLGIDAHGTVENLAISGFVIMQ